MSKPVTITKAAQSHNLDEHLLRSWVYHGKIKAWKEQRRWVLSPESLQKFLQTRYTIRNDQPRTISLKHRKESLRVMLTWVDRLNHQPTKTELQQALRSPFTLIDLNTMIATRPYRGLSPL